MNEPIIDRGMSQFKMLTEELLSHYAKATAPVALEPETVVETSEPAPEHPAIHECREVVFKLRAFMESAGGDYALGVEHGMQRAAEMIENIIRRHEQGDDNG